MSSSDPLWFCHQCNREMRPLVTSPEPLCTFCDSSFIEQLPDSDAAQADDPRAFNPERGRVAAGIGAAIDPITQLLSTVLGLQSGQQRPSTPGSQGSRPGPGPTSHSRSGSEGSSGGRTRSGNGFNFQFGNRSGGTGSVTFGGFGRREEGERREPPGLEELMASMLRDMPGSPNQNQGPGQRGSPLLQHMLMGLFGASIGRPGAGVGMGPGDNSRLGDFAFNEEVLDQLIARLLEANRSTPVPVPEDMISTWPRTILTPGNPLEHEDCAVCKESFAFAPPSPSTSTGTEQPKPPGDDIQPQEALTLPCKHSFHVECIEPWVKVKGTCPVCRFELVPQDGQQEDSNNSGGSSGRPDSSGGSGNSGRSGNGGGSGNSGGPGSSGNSGGDNRREERDRTERGRDSPVPPGAYSFD